MTAEAWAAHAAAAARAGVEVRELDGLEDLYAVEALLASIWGRSQLPAELLRAMATAGCYVSGAYADGELVGTLVGFHAEPGARTLHSHIAGVRAGMTGRSVGFALKLHQRAWALDRGIAMIEWTYDPLIARNARFNLAKLAAVPAVYLPNFYGAMGDVINSGDESDRLLVHWVLEDPVVVAACAGTPRRPVVRPGSAAFWVAVPDDIEAMRVADPAQARSWRIKVRDQLLPALTAGWQVQGFDRDRGYLVVPTEGDL